MQLTEKQLNNFFKKVNKIPGGCWLWTGAKTHGYGCFGLSGKNFNAHRISYLIKNGSLPEGLVLDHFVCQNPGCVNPDHLEPVTQRENVLRGKTIIAKNISRTHCPKGHLYTPQNIIQVPLKSGFTGRKCRACQAIYHKNYKTKGVTVMAPLSYSENKKSDPSTKISMTVRASTCEALNREARKTGNRSFLVDKAIRLYLGLEDTPEQEEKLAS